MSLTTKVTSFRSLIFKSAILSLAMFCIFLANGAINTNAQAFTEGFDVVPVPGWTVQNNSSPVGTTGWFQGNPVTFPSQGGASNSYIGANFNNTTGTNTISNWLITPNRTFSNGDVIKFWTRVPSNAFPDRLQVRLSTSGTSTDVGTTATSVGVFTNLLLDIDPNYSGTYPIVWTEFTITLSGLSGPTSGRLAFRYFVEMGGPTGDNSNYIGIDTFSITPGQVLTPGDAPVDFNGDGKTDYVVARNSGGQLTWFSNLNGGTAATSAIAWGLDSDILVPADYDGDQKDDIAVWRSAPATQAAFYILQSQTNTLRTEFFGQTGDDPTVVADYNNDGKDDVAVYRPGAQSVWYYRTAPGGPVTYVPWGTTGDKVAPGDFNGDGTADFGIARNEGGILRHWRLWNTAAMEMDKSIVFGNSTDTIVTGDFDGDSKTDAATVRSSSGSLVWYWRPSAGGADQARTYGAMGDTLAPGDYDGDGKADPGVFRSGVFYSLNSTNGNTSFFALGATGDRVPASYNAH